MGCGSSIHNSNAVAQPTDALHRNVSNQQGRVASQSPQNKVASGGAVGPRKVSALKLGYVWDESKGHLVPAVPQTKNTIQESTKVTPLDTVNPKETSPQSKNKSDVSTTVESVDQKLSLITTVIAPVAKKLADNAHRSSQPQIYPAKADVEIPTSASHPVESVAKIIPLSNTHVANTTTPTTPKTTKILPITLDVGDMKDIKKDEVIQRDSSPQSNGHVPEGVSLAIIPSNDKNSSNSVATTHNKSLTASSPSVIQQDTWSNESNMADEALEYEPSEAEPNEASINTDPTVKLSESIIPEIATSDTPITNMENKNGVQNDYLTQNLNEKGSKKSLIKSQQVTTDIDHSQSAQLRSNVPQSENSSNLEPANAKEKVKYLEEPLAEEQSFISENIKGKEIDSPSLAVGLDTQSSPNLNMQLTVEENAAVNFTETPFEAINNDVGEQSTAISSDDKPGSSNSRAGNPTANETLPPSEEAGTAIEVQALHLMITESSTTNASSTEDIKPNIEEIAIRDKSGANASTSEAHLVEETILSNRELGVHGEEQLLSDRETKPDEIPTSTGEEATQSIEELIMTDEEKEMSVKENLPAENSTSVGEELTLSIEELITIDGKQQSQIQEIMPTETPVLIGEEIAQIIQEPTQSERL